MTHYTYKSIFALVFLAIATWSCDDFLEEENRTAVSLENAVQDTETFDQLVAAVYERARDNTTRYTSDIYYSLEDLGTDIVTRGNVVSGVDEINDYVNMNSTNYIFQVYWQNQYSIISAANIVLDNADRIVGLEEDDKNIGLGEARFFRAWSYFKLVENFGAVPLVTTQVTGSENEFSREAEEAVYAQIINDLDDALAGVQEAPEEYGRVSKSAVRFLKSKVLLTRGYKSFGSMADFNEAASLAESVIESYPLVSSFTSLVDITNQRNSEVIFSYLFGDDVVSRGWGNSRHQLYKFRYYDYPAIERGNTYQQGLGPAPTQFFYDLFEAGDERSVASFRRVIYADMDSEDGAIMEGDTAIYFPVEAWTQQQISAVPYEVVNPGTYFVNDGVTDVHYPMFRKFDNPGVPFTQPDQPSQGTRDMVMMRSGEAYLLAAEAHLQAGNIAQATAYVNTLRARAGLTDLIGETELDIDFILDERARELAGEANRWMDLKRTGKLIERTLAHNPHAALNNALSSKNLVRPIPRSEIDVTGGSISQNEGYN